MDRTGNLSCGLFFKMEKRYLKIYRIILFLFGIIFLGVMVLMFQAEIINPEWKIEQNKYKNILETQGSGPDDDHNNFVIDIHFFDRTSIFR